MKIVSNTWVLQIAGVLVSGWWLKRRQNQSTPSVLRDSDPLVGSVWHLPVGCVCVGAKKD